MIMLIRRAIKPWIVALLAYALFFQAVAGSIVHARMVAQALNPSAAFDPMASLCLSGPEEPQNSDDQKHGGAEQAHAPCCVLSGRMASIAPVDTSIPIVFQRDPARIVLHAKRYVLAVSLAPPEIVQPRAPPISA